MLWILRLAMLEMTVYLAAAIPPALLFFALPTLQTWYWLALFLTLSYPLVPITLLGAAGLVCRLLPAPSTGSIRIRDDQGGLTLDAERWLLRNSIAGLVYRSPGAWAIPAFPFPAALFFWLVGAEIHPTVAMSPGVTIMDPWLVHIGAGTVVGGQTGILGHCVKDTEEILLSPTVIGERVIVGAHSLCFGGVTIGDGARIMAGSILRPGTVVGPGEVWGGTPARRIGESSTLAAGSDAMVSS